MTIDQLDHAGFGTKRAVKLKYYSIKHSGGQRSVFSSFAFSEMKSELLPCHIALVRGLYVFLGPLVLN